MPGNVWKMQDAKARLSEVVRRAKAGEPQRVTVHGKEGVVVSDPTRFDVVPKPDTPRTMRDFIEGSKKYRGIAEGVEFEQPFPMQIDDRPVFDEDDK